MSEGLTHITDVEDQYIRENCANILKELHSLSNHEEVDKEYNRCPKCGNYRWYLSRRIAYKVICTNCKTEIII